MAHTALIVPSEPVRRLVILHDLGIDPLWDLPDLVSRPDADYYSLSSSSEEEQSIATSSTSTEPPPLGVYRRDMDFSVSSESSDDSKPPIRDPFQSSPHTSGVTPHSSGASDQPRPSQVSPNANNGHSPYKCRRRHAYKVAYSVNKKAWKGRKRGCLVDRGANGCIIGSDMTVVERTDKYIDLTGIEDHTVRELNIVQATCVVNTHLGEVILHIYQGAYMPDGKSIIAPLQVEAYGGTVSDKARAVNGGEQPYVQARDGHRFPLSMRQGLMYTDVWPVLNEEWGKLPHIHLTSDNEWDPHIFDHEVDPDWASTVTDPVEEYYQDLPYDRFGNLKLEGNAEATTRAEIEAHLTDIVKDDLVGSVIEYFVDGEIFHREVDSDDEDCDYWGDWEDANRSQWHGYDVEGRRRSPRTRERIDYSEAKKKNDSATTKKRDRKKRRNRSGESVASTDMTTATGTTKPETSDEESDTPRTDYNNPAKNTDQNDERKLEGGPLVGEPSKIDFAKYRRHFIGASEDVIKKTFENTTQLGRRGAVQGLKLW